MTTVLRYLTRAALVLALAIALLPASPAATGQAPSTAPATTAASDSKKVLTLADYGPWKRIIQTAISDDGKWVTYTYSPNDGDETLFVKQLDGDKLYTIPIGSAAGAGRGGGGGGGRGGGGGGGGAAVQFSDNGRWIGYYVNPPARAAGRGRGGAGGRGAGRGAPPQRGGGTEPGAAPTANAAANPDAVRRFELLESHDGRESPRAQRGGFQFSKGSEWLAIKMTGAPNDTSHRGTDLLLRRLSTGTTQNIGNVNQYDFDDAGKLLAYTVDASSRLGNGVYLLNLGTGEMRALDGAAKDYDGLTWAADSTRLAVLRGEKPEGKVEKENALLAWTDAGAAQPQVVEWDPAKDAAFPQGFVLSEYTAPRWSEGRRARVRRHQGAGRLAARRTASRRRIWTSITGRTSSCSPSRSSAWRQARRATFASRRDRRVEEVRQAGRRYDPDRHADLRRSLGDRA